MGRKTRGFTLVEVIVSIAVLAVASGFILQFFITSDQLNRRSGAVDGASVLAASVIEEYKGQQTPALAARPGSALDGAAVAQGESGATASCAYDEQWNPVPEDDPAAAYDLTVAVQGRTAAAEPLSRYTDGSGALEMRGLYTITVTVRQRNAKGVGTLSEPLLITLSGERYFTWMEGGAP